MNLSKDKKLMLRRATLRLLNREELRRIDAAGPRRTAAASNCVDCTISVNTCFGAPSCPSGG